MCAVAVLHMLMLAETLASSLRAAAGQHVGAPQTHCSMVGVGRQPGISARSSNVMYADDMPLRASHPGDVAAAAAAAEKHGATTAAHTLGGLGGPMRILQLPSRGARRLNVLLTAAVHGNEPAGPAAALQLISRLLGTAGNHAGDTAGAVVARQLRDAVSFTVRALQIVIMPAAWQ